LAEDIVAWIKRMAKNSSSQNWATFLRNHASQIWACDFLQTHDILFRTVFVFVIIELGSRRVIHYGITRNPADKWVAQQLREATPFRERPRFLIRDNDRKYGKSFERVAGQIEVLKTPYRAPKANAICERFLGSLIPCRPERLETPPVNGKLSSRPVLGGLHHDYYWQAAECVGQGRGQPQAQFH
jgi:hypothetical protein